MYNGASVQSTTAKKTSAVLTAVSLAARPQDVEKTFLINNTGPWDSGVHSYNYSEDNPFLQYAQHGGESVLNRIWHGSQSSFL